ncbi:MAG TPA: prolyl oligopeptidase family serine peptidase [Longimicrobiales bacterium]|nr:prolyl oligopeptidase family serine peptidase [Longimicrobiales bacterium]
MLRLSLLVSVAVFATQVSAQSRPTIEQFMGASNPIELTAARQAERVAWTTYDRGMRNVYTAAAPTWTPARITSFQQDDGEDLTRVRLSGDGSIAVFVRGHAPNRDGWVANPAHRATGSERAIWAARTNGTGAWRLVEGSAPELSPDGRSVLYVKDGQIYRVRVARGVPQDSMDRGLKPFIRQWGQQSNPQWSPDGSKIAFVSNRGDHSFIGLYDVRSRRVSYVAPSVDCDAGPTWSPDGKQIAFTRRPGVPFGAQAQPGTGGIGNPPGPAAGRGGGNCGFGGGRGGGRGGPPPQQTQQPQIPGLYRAAFADGSTLKLMIAEVAKVGDIETEPARELWHNQPGDSVFTNISRLMWGAGHLVFPLSPQHDEWDRYWSISLSNPQPNPVLLTTTDGLIEDATSAALSADGRLLYYTTNAHDIERRHIWKVPVSGGTPVAVSSGAGIETHPHPLVSGKQLAVLYFDARTPASVAILPAAGGSAKRIYPTLPKDFPTADHVEPQIVTFKAPDGLEIHNQLFLPKDLKPGERRPALIFVHGGPPRQMLPGYHYMHFYAWAYGVNQWLASQGYVVMSVNYRLGIGYGRSFRQAQNTQARGNAEYQDVLAGGKYLQSRPDVDPARVGIWGLSYGGLLTAQALARNSDVFVAGVDMAGVHLYGNALDTASVSFKSSAVGAIDTWKSPVLLVHGDDDRNVNFAQTVGLVQLLRARNVYHELIVIPDDVHESLLHSRWLYTWNRMGDFLKRFVWDRAVAATQ